MTKKQIEALKFSATQIVENDFYSDKEKAEQIKEIYDFIKQAFNLYIIPDWNTVDKIRNEVGLAIQEALDKKYKETA